MAGKQARAKGPEACWSPAAEYAPVCAQAYWLVPEIVWPAGPQKLLTLCSLHW